MKRGKLALSALTLLAMALSVSGLGCSRPAAELKRAQVAIADARSAGAAEYAPGVLAAAEDALKKGQSQMDGLNFQQAKNSFEASYRLALDAKNKAMGANSTREIFKNGATEPATATLYPLPTTHTVHDGECLWRVSAYKDIYGDPFQWPLIYEANRSQIDRKARASGLADNQPDGRAHWIFPGQQFDIPRDATTDQIKNARARAGAPTPYLPPGQ